MQSLKLKRVPQNEDLINVLKKELGNNFSYCVDTKGKLLIIKNSSLVGANVTIENQVLKIEGTITSKIISGILSLFSVTYMNLFELIRRPMFKLENEVFLAFEKNNI